MKKKNIGIIGAGVAGLSAACRLASKGHHVTVYEKSAIPGGKLSEATWGGYRFDLGPSLFTMPEVFDAIFADAGKNPRDYYDYLPLETITNYFFEDGTRFSSFHDVEKWANEMKTKTGLDPDKLKAYLQKSAFVYDTTSQIFLERSLHRWQTYLRFKTLKSILSLPKIGMGETMASANHRLLNNPYAEQYFNRFATYNGSDPHKAPSTLNLIAHVEHGKGAFYPIGGMFRIAKALHKLAEDLNVKFQFNTPVEKIELHNQKVKGLALGSGEKKEHDIVVSNMDVFFTYEKLLGMKGPKRIIEQEKSTSALIFYWGIKRIFPELHLHNIFFSKNYQREFETLFDKKSIDDDPTIYVNITSKMNSDDAPEGCENWFVMINVPNRQNQDWEKLRNAARASILAKLDRMLGQNLENWIDVEEYLDPVRIETRTLSHLGSLYGNSSNNPMAAFFRHPNFSSKIKGLYFCGGSVHPGGGIPLAALSGKIVSEMVS